MTRLIKNMESLHFIIKKKIFRQKWRNPDVRQVMLLTHSKPDIFKVYEFNYKKVKKNLSHTLQTRLFRTSKNVMKCYVMNAYITILSTYFKLRCCIKRKKNQGVLFLIYRLFCIINVFFFNIEQHLYSLPESF